MHHVIDISNGIPIDFEKRLLQIKKTENPTLVLKGWHSEQIQISQLIVKHHLHYAIELVNFEHSKYQLAIDELIWNNQRQTAEKKTAEPLKNNQAAIPAITRTRPRPKTKLSVEIQIDVDVSFQTEVIEEIDIEEQLQDNTESLAIPQIAFDKFNHILKQHSVIATSIPERRQLWYRILGMIAVYQKDDKTIDVSEDDTILHDSSIDFDQVKCKAHPMIKGMSKDAARAIASNPNAFVDGIDYRHLPKGFRLVKSHNTEDNYTLDFNDTNGSNLDPLSVSIFTAKKNLLISKKVADDMLNKAKKSTKALLLNAHQALLEKHYHRNDLQAFRQNLSLLLTLNKNALAALFKLCHDKNTGHLQGNKLHFYIRNQAKLLSMIDYEVKGNKLSRQQLQIKTFCQDEVFKGVDIANHPLMINLEESSQSFINELNKYYNFSSKQLDSLWRLQAAKGNAALHQVLNTLRECQPDNGNRYLFFQYVNDLSLLVDKQSWLSAFKRITIMDEGQKAWWETLVKQHMANTDEDDMLNLLKHFSQFSRQIRGFNLEFYTPIQFNHVRSLPVALTRMLAIINNCQNENIELQWACITELPLQASGAIRAIDESSVSQPCSFVTPEMSLTAVNYDLNKDKGYQSADHAKDVVMDYMNHMLKIDNATKHDQQTTDEMQSSDEFSAENDDDSQKENIVGLLYRFLTLTNDNPPYLRGLYRYLAWTKHKAPLQFYRHAVKKIDGMFSNVESENLIRTFAYIIMAGATSGLINSAKARQQSKQTHEDLEKLMAFFKHLDKVPKWLKKMEAKNWIRIISLGLFAILEVNPDPKEMLSLVGLFDCVFYGLNFDWGWLTNFQGKMKHIVQPLNNLQALLLEGEPERLKAFLNSIRFIDKADLDGLTNHLNEIRALGEMIQGTPITSKEDLQNDSWNIAKKIKELLNNESIYARYLTLIALKSQFGINYENMHQLKELDINHPTTLYALNLLTQMTNNKGLTIQTLVGFVSALPKPPQADSSHIVANNNEFATNTKPTEQVIKYKQVHQLIRKMFKANFNKAFFKSLTDVDLDKAIIEQIKDALPHSPARDTCLNFFKRFPKNQHQPLVSNLLILAQKLKDNKDKTEFILTLTDNKLFNFKDAVQFKHILTIFDNNGDNKSWLFILGMLKRSKNNLVNYHDFACKALSFWLTHLQPQLKQIDKQVRILPANLFEIIYASYVATYRYVKNKDLTNIAVMWKQVCLELANKPTSCETILSLIKRMIQKRQFSLNRLINLYSLSQSIDDKTALSFATYFLDNRLALLNQFLDKLNSKAISHTHFKLIITIIEKHTNANLSIDKNGMTFLFEKDHLKILKQLYQTPPYPSISQVISWNQCNNVNTSYLQFSLSPCKRSAPDNGFYHHHAYTKALDQIAITPELGISEMELGRLRGEAIRAKSLTIKKLKQQLAAIKLAKPINYEKLTATCAELLYRSMGRQGKTYELNETQYLAVYKLLRDGSSKPLTGKFDSGEGKTRVFMVLAAALFAQGKTVDFITRNMTLAKREFLNFQSYFDLLGAKTTLIHSQSKIDEYNQRQIHFSDVSQFTLFMNHQLSQNQDPRAPKQQRALLLDEADQTYFDLYLTRYNHATTTVNLNTSMNWVYDSLIAFFKISNHQTLYYDDVDTCNKAFRDFVDNRMNDLQIRQLQAVSDDQIETWHDAAINALRLSYEHDFNLSLDEIISVPGMGRQIYSRAVVVKDNREQRQSSFANGVQQCLHARLNWLKTHPNNSKLSAEVAKAQQPFVIRPESDICYYNTSKGFLDNYNESTIIALTGSDGNELEKAEVAALFDMNFIDFPRHNKLRRQDLPLRLCRHENAQIKAIVENIHALQAANQPVLIICEDDKESYRLTEKLKAYFKETTITRIHSGCTSEIEQKHADKEAGKTGQITITTDMYGRGVDIKLHGNGKANGLGVLLTYMPNSQREYIQSINRAGRYGCHGTSRMILNKQRLLQKLGVSSLPSSFFIHSGVPEKKAMAALNLSRQRKRLVTIAITDFQRQLQKVFFAHHFDQNKKTQTTQLKTWSRFDKTIRQMWDKTQHHMDKLLTQKPIQEDKIGKLISDYGKEVKSLWKQTFPDIDISQPCPKIAAIFSKINNMEPQFKAKKPVFSKYDRSHDGFAVLYDHWFAETRAWWRGERCLFANTRAWLRGEGTLFANLQAWWRGEITLWELLFPVGLDKAVEQQGDVAGLQPAIMTN